MPAPWSAELQLVKHILAEAFAAVRRPQRLIEMVDGGQAESGAAGADQHRSHDDMEPIEGAGRQKA